jgi:hypothetical protein
MEQGAAASFTTMLSFAGSLKRQLAGTPEQATNDEMSMSMSDGMAI